MHRVVNETADACPPSTTPPVLEDVCNQRHTPEAGLGAINTNTNTVLPSMIHPMTSVQDDDFLSGLTEEHLQSMLRVALMNAPHRANMGACLAKVEAVEGVCPQPPRPTTGRSARCFWTGVYTR